MSPSRPLLALAAWLAAWALPAMGQRDTIAPDYGRQYRQLYRAYLDDTADVAAMLDLAVFYAAEDNPRHDYALAMKYADRAATLYRDMVAGGGHHRDVTRLIKKGITVDVAQQMAENAILAASRYVVAAKEMSPAELDHLAACAPNSPAMQSLIRKKRTLLAYAEAQRAGTLDAYHAFARRFAGTEEADDSQVAMGLLAESLLRKATTEAQVDSMAAPYSDVPAVQRSAQRRKATLAYNDLLAYSTPQQLQRYLRRYPYTDYYVEVLDMMDQHLAMQLRELERPQDIVDFIQANAASPLAEQAMGRLRRMIAHDHNKEAARLYMAHFPLDERYLSLCKTYYDWYAAEGNGDPIARFARENPHSLFQRAIEADLRLGAVIDSMDLTVPYDEANYAKYVGMVYAMKGKATAYVAMLRTLQPYIAAKNWNALVPRMAEFSPAFEQHGMDMLKALYKVIDAPDDPRKRAASQASPSYHMTHPQMTQNGAYLYYNRTDPGVPQRVCVAQYVKGKKYKWSSIGDVLFSNVEEGRQVTFYSLYDGDRRMVVGMDGDLWTAAREGARSWRVEQRLPAPVNTAATECDATMLEDGSGILFCSDREGGMNCQASKAYFHGDTALATDIYFVAHSQEGWGQEAINLGGGVNSLYCERSPALSSDQKTLYFVTDGRSGMGYGDIYCATRDDVRDWSHWNEAVNYGKETNSGFDEASVSLHGDRLCFATNREGFYSTYGATATEGHNGGAADVAITCDMLARLQVADPATHAVLAHSQHVGDTLRCRLYSGKHYLVIPTDYDAYEAFVPAVACRPGHRGTVQLKAYYPMRQWDETGRMEADTVRDLPLPALNFEPNTATLTPQAMQQLDDMALFLKRNRGVRAHLSVRVDGENPALCFSLGRQRAKLLEQQLKGRGVKGAQLHVANYGRLTRKKNAYPTETTMTLTVL